MKNVMILLVCIALLTAIGFFAGSAIAPANTAEPEQIFKPEAAGAAPQLAKDARASFELARATENLATRQKWATYGGGIGGVAGLVAGILLVMALDRRNKAAKAAA